MKKYSLLTILLLTVGIVLTSCKKEKNDPTDEVIGKWKFKSITVDNITPQGVVYKTSTFDNTYEYNELNFENGGRYEVLYRTNFMFNATYCFKGSQSKYAHHGIWEFDSDKQHLWFDRGVSEYYNGNLPSYSQKYTYSFVDNQLILESTDPKLIADFGYKIGENYFSGFGYTDIMLNNDSTEGDNDGYRNGYWKGYWFGSPNLGDALLDKDAFYGYWSWGVYKPDNRIDTTGISGYPNYRAGYLNGHGNGYADGFADASSVPLSKKTYKMKIVYTKL